MLRALKGKIIVKLKAKELVSESGIFVRLSETEQPYGRGIAYSVGDVQDVEIGDELLFDDCTNNRRFIYEDEEYMTVFPEEIICKLVDYKPVPILNKVLVDENPEYDVSKGGIIIPEEARNGSCFGTVVATGKGKIGIHGKRLPLTILKGEMIYYSQWRKLVVEIKNMKYTLMREDSIFGILENVELNARIEQEKWRR